MKRGEMAIGDSTIARALLQGLCARGALRDRGALTPKSSPPSSEFACRERSMSTLSAGPESRVHSLNQVDQYFFRNLRNAFSVMSS